MSSLRHQYSKTLLLFFWIAATFARTTVAFEFPFGNISPSKLNKTNKNNNKSKMRAWNCHGRNQKELVEHLFQAQIIQMPAVQKVMEQVDRGNYVPEDPYMDAPQSIGLGQTISAPHMHAHALEEIYPYIKDKAHLKLMDVGCGSGYLTAALGRWVHPKKSSDTSILTGPDGTTPTTGNVFAIDVHQHLVDMTTKNIQKVDGDLLSESSSSSSPTMKVELRDGWKGWKEHAPFDAIHVGAAAETLPKTLAQQLKIGGVLIVPVGPQHDVQYLYKVVRIDDAGKMDSFVESDYETTNLLGVRYVPLVHPNNL